MADRKIILSNHFGTFRRTGEVFDIIFERHLPYPVEVVWDAITNPDKLEKWLGRSTVDLKLKGNITIDMQGMEIYGQILSLKEQNLLEYTWASQSFPDTMSIVRFELTKESDTSCRLKFMERLVGPQYLSGAGPGWHYVLDTLSRVLEGKTIPPWDEKAWQQVSEQAVEKYKAILAELEDSENLAPPPAAKAGLLIRKPIAEVFEAFIDPAITSRFWFSRGSGRLDGGQPVTWYWDDYGVNAEVSPHAIIKDKLIFFTWPAPGDIITTVEIHFSPRGKNAAFVTVEEKGWSAVNKKVIELVAGQTEGWTLVLTGLKAWLEHGIKLNLVADHNPEALAGSPGKTVDA